ncbi:MAG: RnfABCDGE type electron transport complex subunit B [Planctomycetes bacterium]|nr:RnfABCDGE type electron transport complex subunit B [Planctomycetota bacterium]
MLLIGSIVIVAALSMTVLGALFGLGLMLAARAFRTDQDPRVAKVLDALPGANCGACGYAGCRSYAEAVAQEGEDVGLCIPGGPDAAAALADIMGVEPGEAVRHRAVVHCRGGRSLCPDRFEYAGEQNCTAAALMAGGPKACPFGCLGFGSCAEACPFGAITMSEDRLPVIDAEKCTGCGICVDVCPRNVISLLPAHFKIYLGCSSQFRGKAVKELCPMGCIACRLCAREDPNDAIKFENNLPVLDYDKAGGDFSAAADACPLDCFILADRAQPVPAGAAGSQQGASEETQLAAPSLDAKGRR